MAGLPSPGFRTQGQAAALRVVERAVRSERAPHALLLVGPPRVGKTTLALDLAAGLLCLADDPGMRPCRECAACRKVEHGNHPDLHLFAPEGVGQQIRVAQVHALTAELALLPLEGRFRVAIIESAHRLNLDAQHAILKTLEEPPAAVVLVLGADDSASLLPTVISRCARLRLGPVAPEIVARMLEAAGVADRSQGATIARLSGGRPGVALELATRPEAVIAQGRLARALLDLLDADRRRRLALQADLLDDGQLLAAGAAVDAVAAHASEGGAAVPRGGGRGAGRGAGRRQSPAERRAAVARVIAVWREVARDLALAAHGGRAELGRRDMFDELVAAGERVEPAAVGRFVARLDALARAIDGYANPELALDVLLLEWPMTGQRAA
jgi:DNA polymerase-3 subunit delta'